MPADLFLSNGRTIASLILSGLLDRYPTGLRLDARRPGTLLDRRSHEDADPPGALDSRDRPDRSRPEARPVLIGQALDAGAAGVIVPATEDRATGEAVARAVRYPPEGGGA
jgi:hypothetical protein